MTTAERVYRQLQSLPETTQQTVLDFVEFLAQKQCQEAREWMSLSVGLALRGMEEETWPEYNDADFKERW